MDGKIIVLLFFIHVITARLFIRSVTTCGKPLIQIRIIILTIDDSYQLFNATYSSKIPNGDNMESVMKIYLLTGGKWTQLTQQTEKRGTCALLDQFIGPMFHDIERAAGIMTRCPIPAGTYHWKNYKPNFENMKLPLPPGRIKINVEAKEKSTKKLGMCVNLEAENKL